MSVNIWNKRSGKYSSYYIVKFIGFMPIFYTINLDIVLFFIVFSNLYLEFMDLL